MSLRDTAHSDLMEIFSDTIDGPDEISIISPAGSTETLRAFTNDIHFSIDPETQMTVTGRQCSAAVSIAALEAVDFGEIKGIPDKTERPWVVQATDANGVLGTFKVSTTHPDRGAGIMILILEGYQL